MALLKKTIAGRYQIERQLGAGGMALVYLAHDPQLDRDVAIKVPKTDDGSEPAALERFRSELRAIGRLSHPNVVTVYDGGEDGDQPFLVMELVLGESLAELVQRQGQLPAREAAAIARQVADALAYAHNLGIVHRDVKPRNILLDSQGRAKVTDFGIARSTGDATRTMAGTVIGTPSYLAPEVTAGQPASPLSDIYAVGVLLYYMLTGHTPFESENPIAEAVRSQQEDPRPPSELASVPAWLDRVTLRALARDPRNRYQSAAELSRDLTASGGPAAWQGPTQPDDTRTQVLHVPAAEAPRPRGRRRRRFFPLLAGAALVGILGGAAVFAWQTFPQLSLPVLPTPTAPAQPAPAGRNLIANGDLGGASTAGPPSGWKWDKVAGVMDAREGYFWRPSGPSGEEVGLTAGGSGLAAFWSGQPIKVSPGWKLTLSGYVKTTNVPAGSAGATLRLACSAADNRPLQTLSAPPKTGSGDWSQVSAAVTIPPNAANCIPQLWLGAPDKPVTGSAEFSKISLAAAG